MQDSLFSKEGEPFDLVSAEGVHLIPDSAFRQGAQMLVSGQFSSEKKCPASSEEEAGRLFKYHSFAWIQFPSASLQPQE